MVNFKMVLMEDNDYEFIYDVKKDAFERYVILNFGIWNEDMQRDFHKKFVETNRNNIYIIYLDGIRIGFYQDLILENGDYKVGNICIIPKYQGIGIGTKILNDMLEKYKERNIHIQYFKQNPVGNLYARLGFVPNGETEHHYQMIKYKRLI